MAERLKLSLIFFLVVGMLFQCMPWRLIWE